MVGRIGWRWLTSVLLVSGAAVAGCSGSGGTSSPVAATPGTVAPSETAPAGGTGTPSAFATPVVAGQTYAFPQKGYSVEAPAGWAARPNFTVDVAQARFPMDTFVAPDVASGVQPSVTVECLKPREDQATTEQYRDGWRAFLQQLVGKDVAPRDVAVGPARGFAFDYAQSQEVGSSLTADKTDVVFVAGTCRWQITLLAPAGQRAKFLPVLDGMLASFKLL